MFYIAYKPEQFTNLSKDDQIYILGIKYNDEWVKLPRCPLCGGLLVEDSLYGLCDDCGMFFKLYISLNRKDWVDDESYL